MNPDLILVRNEGRVRILTLNRPEARNALNAALREALIQAMQEAETDPDVGAVVLTGAGNCFAAGADLRELLERNKEQQRAFLQPPHIYSVIENLTKPVLAALNGHALGAGLELATACDIRVAAPTAKLGQPEIHLALIPGGGGSQRLVRLLGRGGASRLVLTGDAVDATTAHAMGLVDEVADETVARTIELAQSMARHDPQTLQEAKAALHDATRLPYDEGLAKEIERFVALHGRSQARMRIQDFLDG